VKGRKYANTIWKLKDHLGASFSSFEGLAQMGKNHFQSLFRDDPGVNIQEIIRLALLFPNFVDEDKNKEIFIEVGMEELKETLHSF